MRDLGDLDVPDAVRKEATRLLGAAQDDPELAEVPLDVLAAAALVAAGDGEVEAAQAADAAGVDVADVTQLVAALRGLA